ncbi:hypothetical protein SAMN05428967_2261 [Phyllobacterium sp. YR620]|uniref:hypothetical protein n=1 Tax=Phyllobacterium sp. YR620 TaxID=1881066 RepID=UPI0008805D13|nr:hypothetical protein [Phyllobacterium sp. YR620]SDP47001.1 hypothetical protein SAMN05428967_2261 [Phyllobacterium sp. YR620]
MSTEANAADDSARLKTAKYLSRKAEFEAASNAGFDEAERLVAEYIAGRKAQ